MTSFREEIENITHAAQADIAAAAQAERTAAAQRHKASVDDKKSQFSKSRIESLVRDRAASGSSTAYLDVFSFEDDVPDWWGDVALHIKAIASGLGIGCETSTRKVEPTGSDPLVCYTTYEGFVRFEWK
jgi:hypothetical protein